jgi:hypothetical protein
MMPDTVNLLWIEIYFQLAQFWFFIVTNCMLMCIMACANKARIEKLIAAKEKEKDEEKEKTKQN